MNESSEIVPERCPGCQKPLQPKWLACRYCGMRLKPANDLVQRSILWTVILGGFVAVVSVLAIYDASMAAAIGLLAGVPLAYLFGKAALFRLRGQALTIAQLGRTSVRAFLFAFLILVVLPAAIGAAILIFAFLICLGANGS